MSQQSPEGLPGDATLPAMFVAGRMAPLPGNPEDLISARFQIKSMLGRGGFGRVYRAFDQKLGREVALKMLELPGGAPVQGEKVRLFQKEAKAVASLDHPHIVHVYEAELEGEIPWIAMKLVEGSCLEALLGKETPMEPTRVLRLLAQLASALSHAHRRVVVHRDVKPANILLEQREGAEHVWLTDFGIAKLLTDVYQTSKDVVVGTPSYMSPEQATGRSVDARTDLFSLGCVAVEMATGHRPFNGDSVTEVLNAIIHHQPELTALRERAGRDFEAIVQRCLAKSPEDRWKTADDLRQALEALLQTGKPPKPRFALSRIWLRHPRPAEWDEAHPLVTEGLRKAFGFGKPVLAGLDLKIPRGAVYALLGRNGSGKSTLIRTCLGLYQRDAGRVRVFGRDPEREGPAVLARVGLVSDTLPVDEGMKVAEILAFVSRFYSNWDQAYCYRLLARYDLPLDKRIRALSRGMKTKVALVLALAHRPDLLVLDDPTLGLDAVILDEFIESLEEAAQNGATIVIASHNHGEIERIATHVGLVQDARLLFTDTVANLKAGACEVQLTFTDEVPDLHDIQDFRLKNVSGRKAQGIILANRGTAVEQLKAMAPQDLKTRDLSLREICVQLLK